MKNKQRPWVYIFHFMKFFITNRCMLNKFIKVSYNYLCKYLGFKWIDKNLLSKCEIFLLLVNDLVFSFHSIYICLLYWWKWSLWNQIIFALKKRWFIKQHQFYPWVINDAVTLVPCLENQLQKHENMGVSNHLMSIYWALTICQRLLTYISVRQINSDYNCK